MTIISVLLVTVPADVVTEIGPEFVINPTCPCADRTHRQNADGSVK
jgi:hypothetical protein